MTQNKIRVRLSNTSLDAIDGCIAKALHCKSRATFFELLERYYLPQALLDLERLDIVFDTYRATTTKATISDGLYDVLDQHAKSKNTTIPKVFDCILQNTLVLEYIAAYRPYQEWTYASDDDMHARYERNSRQKYIGQGVEPDAIDALVQKDVARKAARDRRAKAFCKTHNIANGIGYAMAQYHEVAGVATLGDLELQGHGPGAQGLAWIAKYVDLDACGIWHDMDSRKRLALHSNIVEGQSGIVHYVNTSAIDTIVDDVYQIDLNAAYVNALREPLPYGKHTKVAMDYVPKDDEFCWYASAIKGDYCAFWTKDAKQKYVTKMRKIEGMDLFLQDYFDRLELAKSQGNKELASQIKLLGVAIVGQLFARHSLAAACIYRRVGSRMLAIKNTIEAIGGVVHKINTDSIAFAFWDNTSEVERKTFVASVCNQHNAKIEHEGKRLHYLTSQTYQYEQEYPHGVHQTPNRDTLEVVDAQGNTIETIDKLAFGKVLASGRKYRAIKQGLIVTHSMPQDSNRSKLLHKQRLLLRLYQEGKETI